MTYGIAGHRRRALSISSPVAHSDPIAQLDHVVDILNKVNRMLPLTTPDREELIRSGVCSLRSAQRW